jgi:betaine-aldehyde dehydrogenase
MRLPANLKLFYAGKWHDPHGGYAPTLNPATNQPLADAPLADAKDVDDCAQAARKASRGWRSVTPETRCEALRKIAQIIRANIPALALLDSANNGNPVSFIARNLEYAVGLIEYFATLALEVKASSYPSGANLLRFSVREPYGVCARLVAYNHPALFLAAKLAPALAAGNCVVMKAPDQAPLSSLLLVELIQEVLPAGVLSLLTGNRDCGDALTRHPNVSMVTLIGGAATGRAIMRTAADGLKRVLLELGGKNALVVYPSADLNAAANAAVSGMSFGWAGQSCGSTSRLFLHEDIHDEVLEKVLEGAARFIPGIPTQPETNMGALITQSHLNRVLGYVESGKKQGASLVLGGSRPQQEDLKHGNFLAPTVFSGVTADMTIAREEIFGPVLSVIRWSDEEQMIESVNAVEYGLTTALFTGDTAQALRAAARIEAGCIGINSMAFHSLGSPFGGYKHSGIGREECLEELLEFTQLKTYAVELGK